MGLFDWIFKDEQVEAAHEAKGYFTTLTAYRPHFTTWRGEIYESELVRAAIDARARNISKLKVEIIGSAKPTLQTQLRLRPNTWQTWSQFLYRCSTILDMQNTLVIVPVYDRYMAVVGYYPVLPKRCEVIDVNGEPWLRYEFYDGKRAADRWGNVAVLTRFQYKSDFFGESNHALDPTMKLVHMLPMVFTVGVLLLSLVALVALVFALIGLLSASRPGCNMGLVVTYIGLVVAALALSPLLLYALIIFIDSSIRNRSLKVGLLSVPAAFVQLMGYGLGFLKAWWKRCVLKQDEFTAFEKNFYK